MTKIAKMGLISKNISIELLCLKRCYMAGHLEKENWFAGSTNDCPSCIPSYLDILFMVAT